MRTATLDLNSRGSFVDDLNSKPGIVMCRDALLHRSHEIQPAFFDSEKKESIPFFLFYFFYAPGTCPWSGPCRTHGWRGGPAQPPPGATSWPAPKSDLTAALVEDGSGPRAHHTFSAFWLRSSVVSVLISLISGTWRMASHEI